MKHILKLSTILTALLLLFGCETTLFDHYADGMPSPDPTPDKKLTSAPYSVGDYYYDGTNEGVVFEIGNDGNSGKIVSVNEMSTQWGTSTIDSGTTDVNDGAKNMATIKAISGWESKYPAFKWCADIGTGWYLPAKNELKAICNQGGRINSRLLANNFKELGSTANNSYPRNCIWSSSQNSSYDYCAYIIDFSTGQIYSEGKTGLYAVRAVYAFVANEEPEPEPDNGTIPNNEIWYTSTDGKVVTPNATDVFGASIVSNTYNDGKGVIKFSSNVTSIGTKAFYSCTNITSITIPSSVTKIGVRAFAGCDITSIKIPDSTTEIGEAAFAGSNLANVIIPDSVTEIREGAFSNCDSLTSVTIGSGVTLIEASAFFACINLTEFNGKFASTDKRCLIVNGTLHSFAPSGLSKYTIPNSVTSVGDYAFDCCSNLTSITIPSSVTSIGFCAFDRCSSLKSITIPDSVTEIEAEAFSQCSRLVEFIGKFASTDKRCLIVNGVLNSFAPFGLTEYTIPDSVTSIEKYAFYKCSSLASITIPDSVTHIGHYAFLSCTSLKSIYCKPTTPPTLDSYPFDENASGRKIYVPNSSVSAYKSSKYWGLYADAIVADPATEPTTIPNNEIWYTSTDGYIVTPNVTDVFSVSIVSNTYSNGKGVIKFSGDISSIGENAFSGCNGLASIAIPDSVTSIGNNTFSSCHNLTSIPIPDSVTLIGIGAFSDCYSLTNITIPDNVTSIGARAFSGCSSLTEFNGKFASTDKRCLIVDGVLNSFAPYGLTKYTIPDNVTAIGSYAFRSCSSLTSITIPDSITEIGGSAFIGCSNLTSIAIPNSVTEIESNTFRSCSSLTSITIPERVTEIGERAFDGCSSLTSVTIPERVTEIGWYAFADCSSLTSITIPDGVTEIGVSTFDNCINLTSITIPDSVTEIKQYAFKSCSSLTSVTIGNSVASIGSYAFYKCNSLKSVYCKSTTPPTLGNSSVFDSNASDRNIYVPSSSVSAYKSAQYWSEYADAIVADPATEPATIPNNEIWYTSTDGNIVTPSRTLSSYYGANIISNTYNNGKGIIAFDNTVTQIGAYAFDGCSTLKSITIPNSVTTIGTNVFNHCSNLTSVTLGSSITGISSSAFANCTSLTSIVIPDSVTKIYSSAFSGCTSLTDVTLGTKVSSIGDYAFTNCSNLKNINIPNSVTEICGSAFAGCSSLTNIVMSDNVISIGENAFNQCKGLTKITIGNSVKTISSNAFKACSNLTSVTIPSSVTSLGSYVFSGCSSLAAVYCKPTNPPTGGYTMFFGNASSRKIYVPSSSVEAYKTANNWSEYADYIVAE